VQPPKHRYTVYECTGSREEGTCKPVLETENLIEALIEAYALLRSASLAQLDIEKVEEGENDA